jgi:UDP-galactopyranose mutase
MFDFLIVGAGFAGSVLAERLARGGRKKVCLIDRRSHLGGNAYDHKDASGLLVHRYGPHIFHTNSAEVFTYLSRFTQWRAYEHRVLSSVDGKLVPIPINLNTINQLYDLELSPVDLARFFAARAEPRPVIKTSEDVVVSQIGRELYEKFFRNYTRKQWGLDHRSSMRKWPHVFRSERIGIIAISPTAFKPCRYTAIPVCLKTWWTTRASRFCWG